MSDDDELAAEAEKERMEEGYHIWLADNSTQLMEEYEKLHAQSIVNWYLNRGLVEPHDKDLHGWWKEHEENFNEYCLSQWYEWLEHLRSE